jgi:hypothetical protein
MSRARILADYVSSGDELADKAPLASPAFTGTATFSGDIVPSTPLSHRNMIINGGMNVAQRSTSVTSITATGYHAVDRIQTQFTNGGTWTIAQSTDAPAGFSNSFRMDCTATADMGSANDFVGCMQKIEAQNLQHLAYGTASAKAMVMSFWVKSNKTGTYAIMFYAPDGGRIVGANYTISAGDTWEYKTITIPADTGGTMNNDNGEGFRALFYLATGTGRTSGTARTSWSAYALSDEAVGHNVNVADNTANDWSITGVQLELGSNATPFEHRSYGDELARCQRYYINSKSIAGTNDKYTMPIVRYHPYVKVTNYWSWASAQFPVVMRTIPNTKGCFDTSGTDGKIMYWSNQSGANTDNHSPHTMEAGPMHIALTVYIDTNYGFAAHYWADAEL